MKKTLIPIALVFALIAVAPAAFAAGSANSTFTVQANVAANCTVSVATLSFGAYDPIQANATGLLPLDGSTPMTVACTKGFTPTVGIAAGGRTITNGSDTLTYQLYSNPGRTTVWDDGAGLYTLPTAPGKSGTDYTIYGRIPGGLDVSTGSYSGTIKATVNF
jgi:spore coat protein U-like protein